MYGAEADNDIISRVLQGDHRAYSDLVKRYQDFVFTIALKYTMNREEAEEMAQDVFVKAYRSLKDFQVRSKFSTWLYTITRNTCLTFLRIKKRNTLSLNEDHVSVLAVNKGTNDVNDHMRQRSTAVIIKESIELLDHEDAMVVTLFYKLEQTLEEVAQIMGITPNNVKVKLHRARKKLKQKMEIYYNGELDDIINA